MAERANPGEADPSDRQTRLAEERTLLEQERTLAAWIRTGLSAIVVGFAAAELLPELKPGWLTQAVGAAMIVAGGVLLMVAYRSYRGAIERLRKRKVPGVAPWVLVVFVRVLVLSAVAALYLLLA